MKVIFLLIILYFSACTTKQVEKRALSNIEGSEFICLSKEVGFAKGCLRFNDHDNQCNKQYSFHKTCRADLGFIIPIEEIGKIVWGGLDSNLNEQQIYNQLPKIPDSIYNKYSSKEIALSLIQRKFIFEEIPKMSEQDFINPRIDLFQDLQIAMEFPSKYLSSIVKKGFQNLHQTGKSTAFNDTDFRLKRESLFFKVQFSKKKFREKINEILPKYAYAIPVNDDGELGPTYIHGYADLVAIFKDRVKLSSTLANNDTLFGQGSWGLLDFKGNSGFLPPLTFTALNS